MPRTCSICNGTGRIYLGTTVEGQCERCFGTGLEQNVELTVADLLTWLRGRPGASWIATISDIEIALAEMKR